MAGLMFFQLIIPVFAAVDETYIIKDNDTSQIEVYYNQGSNFEIKVPKLINLGSDKLTNYNVSISGDISSNETIHIVPENNFLMKDISGGSNPKADVKATVTQDKTEWNFEDITTIGKGTVSAPGLTAGTWSGKFYFNISLIVTEKEFINLGPGLYDENNNLICPWENSGINVEQEMNNPDTSNRTSGMYVLKNVYPETRTIVFPETISKIGKYEFYGCDKLERIIVSNTVKTIENNAFENCTSLKYITISESVTSISDAVFYNCSSLTELIVPDNVTHLGRYAFGNCINLVNITLPNQLTTISDNLFGYCPKLTNIIIPESVTTISDSAFYGCNSLTSIVIPRNVTSIGIYVFNNCNNLTKITFDDTTTWYVGSSKGQTSTQVDVTNETTNATYLRSTHINKYWTKK
jgi:hypothetical protein